MTCKKGQELANLELIRFGILHNYLNNFKSRITLCTGQAQECAHGSMRMDAKFAAESVRKYFDLALNHRSSPEDAYFSFHFDGMRYHFDLGEGDPIQFAKVTRATKEGGIVRMTGNIYSESNADERPELVASFTVTAKPHKWNGKDTWAILSLKRKYR